jgi:hypothetical protein
MNSFDGIKKSVDAVAVKLQAVEQKLDELLQEQRKRTR